MPITNLLQERTFEPATVKLITISFDRVCRTLRLTDQADPLREHIARKVVQIASKGEYDPHEIYEQTLNYVISDECLKDWPAPSGL